MLLLEVKQEARALIYLAEEQGEDPEAVALQFAEATQSEVHLVIREVYRIQPALKQVEWYEDFRSAHRWNRNHPAGA